MYRFICSVNEIKLEPVFQNAIKAQKIDLSEIDKEILGTTDEKQRPLGEDTPNKDDKK